MHTSSKEMHVPPLLVLGVGKVEEEAVRHGRHTAGVHGCLGGSGCVGNVGRPWG